MTPLQKEQFNKMRLTLKRIAAGYETPERLRKSAESVGLSPEEAIEYAYENIQREAMIAVRGVRVMSTL